MDKIQFNDPKALEEAIRKDKYLHEKNKGISYFQKDWDDRRKTRWNRGRSDSSHHSLGQTLEHTSK
jgi:hypothetical protein